MRTLFKDAAPLALDETLDCGQAFRWRANPDGSFTGVVRGRLVTVSLAGGGRPALAIDDITAPPSGLPRARPLGRAFWRSYFALDIDYAALQAVYSADATLARCVAAASGIRVLRQDFFETLISFLISQNNNIRRIKDIVERLCDNFGEPVGRGPDGRLRHAFPTAERLAALDLGDLGRLRAGYRDRGILDAARRVADGRLRPAALARMGTPKARAALLEVYGVGPKVADCVLLFGLGRFEAFPVDVWVRRAMARLFPPGLPACARPTAGIAQQYLFHAERTGRRPGGAQGFMQAVRPPGSDGQA